MNEERRASRSEVIDAAAGRVVPRAEERGNVQREHIEQHPDTGPAPLFADAELTGYRSRWSAIQTGFVDEPRRAVEQADSLVSELMTRLTDTFTNERRNLEGQWEKADKISTEDLRIAMQRYRSFFERLLTI